MTIISIAALVKEVRSYAERRPLDFGWREILQMPDEQISEIILDEECSTTSEVISTFQDLADAFNDN